MYFSHHNFMQTNYIVILSPRRQHLEVFEMITASLLSTQQPVKLHSTWKTRR